MDQVGVMGDFIELSDGFLFFDHLYDIACACPPAAARDLPLKPLFERAAEVIAARLPWGREDVRRFREKMVGPDEIIIVADEKGA